ncbi:MAG: hypothetical protein J5988_03220 [Eubacterium sp.]|nr:hypothetical protein [Eubacterium sp.]
MSQFFLKFDNYITSKMLGLDWESENAKDFSEDQRYQAYRHCLDKMGSNRVASFQTVQKWFGLKGSNRPNRETLIQLAFALGFSEDEATEMLVKGAMEPEFQVNDYREMIFLYGLLHGMSYEECLDLIEEFEVALPESLSLVQHNHTDDLWQAYGKNCELEKEDFLAWMLENAEEFKGYSMTVLNFYRDLKHEIIHEMKIDVSQRLEELLSEIGFCHWEQKRHLSKGNRKKTVAQYLKKCQKNGTRVSKEMEKMLKELLQMLHVSEDSNTDFLAEIYADLQQRFQRPNKRRGHNEIRIMDDKYLSELLNIGAQKEKLVQMIMQEVHLSDEQKNDNRDIYEQRRRCRLLERQDILPLILVVAQKRYIRKLEREEYDASEAKKQFTDLANRILVSCHMTRLDEEKYELDALVCSCFASDEMYSFSDVLEKYLVQRGAE